MEKKKYVKTTCANCGASLTKYDDNNYKCKYCDSVFPIETFVGKKVIKVENKTSKWLAIIFLCCFLVILPGIIVFQALNSESTTTGNVTNSPYPQGFQDAVAAMFNKPLGEVSYEERESVTNLTIDVYGDYVYITFVADGVVKNAYFEGFYPDVFFHCYFFPQLEEIHVHKDAPLYDFMTKGLKDLKRLTCTSDICDLTESLECPEKIEYLSGVEYRGEIKDLSVFENLKYLDVTIFSDVKDYGPLTQLKGLEELYIRQEFSNVVINYDFVKELPNLKKLYIEDDLLEDLSFLEELENLEVLVLDNTEIVNLDALTCLKNLKALSVTDAYELEDVSIINSFTGLEELHLDKCCEQVEYDKLQNLKILDVTVYNEKIDSISDNLECLKLYNANIGDYFEEILGLKNLSQLRLSYCRIDGVNYDDIVTNENLKVLVIDGLYSEEPLRKHTDIFNKFPGLEQLSLRENSVENIDFLMNMPELEVLDIYNNNISDLSVIKYCPKLRFVNSAKNAVSEDYLFPNLEK